MHLEDNFERDIVPSLNVDKAQSIGSMKRVKELMAKFHATLFINHDKQQTDQLKLLPGFYDDPGGASPQPALRLHGH